MPRVMIENLNPDLSNPTALAASLGVTGETWDADRHIGLLVFHVGDASGSGDLDKPNIFVWTKDDGWLLVKAN